MTVRTKNDEKQIFIPMKGIIGFLIKKIHKIEIQFKNRSKQISVKDCVQSDFSTGQLSDAL